MDGESNIQKAGDTRIGEDMWGKSGNTRLYGKSGDTHVNYTLQNDSHQGPRAVRWIADREVRTEGREVDRRL